MTQQMGQNRPPPTTQVAHQQAAEVGRTTADAGRDVAATASDQAGHVAHEVRRQARDLLGEARGQAKQQAHSGQQKAAESIRDLARELHEMAEGGDHHGTASDLAVQAADRLHGVADWIGAREPGDLVDEVRRFARNRPGSFLLGAAVAGVLAGRLTRGAVDAQRDTSSDANRYRPGQTTDATTGPYPGTPPPAMPAQPYNPAQPYSTVPAAGGPPLGGPVGAPPPASHVAGGNAFPPPAPPVPPVAPPRAAPPVVPPPVTGPQHTPRPGSTTVGEYVEHSERESGPRGGGPR